MTRLHHEIFINAAPENVWAALADLETVEQYNPLVAKTYYISDHRSGIGAARHCDFIPKGFSKERVTDWEAGKLLGLETTESSFPMKICRWKTYISPQGNGTFVSQDLEYSMKFGWLGDLLNALILKKKYNDILGGIFDGLKKFVENQ